MGFLLQFPPVEKVRGNVGSKNKAPEIRPAPPLQRAV